MSGRWPKLLAWILFLTLLGGFFFYLIKKGPSSFSPAKPAEKTEQPAKPEQDVVPSEQATLSPLEKRNLDLNLFNQALKNGSEATCQQIAFDLLLKQKCLDGVRYVAIINERTPEQCDRLFEPQLREFCRDKIYFLTGVDRFNEKSCKQVKNEIMERDCLDQINILVNANTQTLTSCNKIQNTALRTGCSDQQYYKRGVTNKATADCNKIADRVLKERCLKLTTDETQAAPFVTQPTTTVTLTSDEQLSRCSSLETSNQQTCKDQANFNLAFEKKDIHYCSRIQSPEERTRCENDQSNNINRYYLRMAMAQKDQSFCQKILSSDARQSCLEFVTN